MDSYHILIVEDVTETAEWLKARAQTALGNTVKVSHAHTLASARNIMRGERFNIAVLDLGLPDGSGIDLIHELITSSPGITVVVATIYDDDEHIFAALRSGAAGYLLKDQSDKDIEQALIGISAGTPPVSPSVARRVIAFFHQQQHSVSQEAINLTSREQEVLILIASGMSIPEAAASLNISAHTTRGYVKDIYRKLGISTRAEASLKASRMGLLGT
jgi:DNA-binding NarL/FixJ family response regulator